MAKASKKQIAPEGDTNSDKEKTSVYIRKIVRKDVNYIMFSDEKNFIDIIDEALTDYVAKWEKKNGPIPKKA